MSDVTPTGTPPVPPAGATPAAPVPPPAPPAVPPAAPPMVAAPVPPAGGQPTGPATPSRGRRGWLVALAVVGALLVGGGIGYAAGMPQRNSLQDDKAALQEDLTAVKKDLSSARDDLSSAQAGSKAKDVCVTAATDAGDYITQVDNWFVDFNAYMESPSGSGAEAQLDTHLTDQEQKMDEQYDRVQSELRDCRAALAG